MRHLTTFKLFRPLAIALALSASHAVMASEADHQEFEATLHVPYATSAQARVFTLAFDYPHVERLQEVSWKLELVSPSGQVVQRWHGVQRMFQKPVDVKVRWAGRAGLADGIYKVRMQAVSNDAAQRGREPDLSEEAVERLLAAGGSELVEQSWDLAVGKSARPAMPAFSGLQTNRSDSKTETRVESKSSGMASVQMAAPAPGALPYTVYFGNLHSQTNHSDGGGALGSCTGAQAPQSAALGPAQAYAYARDKGLDILMASEHNHMFDGSDGTDTSASPATAKALFKSGLSAAADFNAANPDFLGVYGLEWGVINNGGHMNIFNTPELLEWELNSSGQVIGDTLTPKGDYSGLYTLMRQRGWVGQFNHPSSSGQFLVGGVPLGYTADGDQAMALCEVLNTAAFSNNTTETETGRSSFEGACNKALEAGFHVAFASNQDNHCANWGASYTNRTGVLIPNGTPLTQASFIEALKARRVFATMDKSSQLVLTANGRIMGERFSNSGPLKLIANFASTSGRTVSTVSIVEGVPGRKGAVSQLSGTANTTVTPSAGEHFYYAKLTQDDGKILWSAPIWVTQTDGGGDTTAPRVTAGESGASGTISVSASAIDDVGVTRVEFYVDNQLKASSGAAPYSAMIDSTSLINGIHSLVAKAYDAAGNVGTSAAVTFSVNNASGGDTTPPTVSASASGSSGTIGLAATASDNGGISRVEFYVDNVLKGTDATSPYTLSLNSATLSNGSHQLTAKAFDVALNSAVSAPVSFIVSNAGAAQQLLVNSGFESGASGWVASSGVITSSGQAAHGGSWKAALNGAGSANTATVYQQVTIRSTATSANLAFWLKVVSSETTSTSAYDKLKVQVRSGGNAVLATLATYSNLNKGSSYLQKTFDLSAYKGQTVRIYFEGVEGSTIPTAFLIDDVTLTTQ
ncbi:CehA/McbA family metallohydrolase [Massilia sp. P8910]|uniref:Ig-like domain-containing protein n=1 Tax=Massilia antarctica TaxID=2765360 RepID=UPI001E5B2DEF|nr:Ig-like domain-containing protein [Massilia antarctica]MCE3608372.1 CehA/McbA family metallohydrolase [Massilia antarctica]